MRLLLLQLNPVIGDLPGNADRIRQGVVSAGPGSADLVLTPELALTGYPPRDLLLFRAFIGKVRQAAEELAADLEGYPPVLAGAALPNPSPVGRPLQNVALLLQGGKVVRSFGKTLLPTYDVFDEDRYFEPATANEPVEFNGRKIGLTICEDVWNDEDFWDDRRYRRNPAAELARAGAKVLLNSSASPWHLGKNRARRGMLSQLAAKTRCPVLYCNLV
ncbi:MAG: NAD+ synthase, partial [Methanomicrobiales archaeon]|nr:NAD+ synthase [Methanomicrobiales archaeon]